MRNSLIVPVLLMLISCNQNESTAFSKKEEAKTDTVKVFIVKEDSAQKTISLPGELLPYENVFIRAKVQGYISSVKVDIGTRVSRGQVLALIEAPEINTRIQELLAKEKAAQSRYEASKDYYDRINTAAKAEGVIAASELEKTKNQVLADEAEYNAARFAASSYKQVGNYLAVVAPYNGVVTKRNIDVGSLVGSTTDKPLFEIEENITLRLRTEVPEIYINAIITDNAGELSTRSLPDKKIKAKLVRKSGSIDQQSRTETWEFEVPNSTGELKAGSYADVKLHFLRQQQTIVLPASAIVSTLEKRFVIKVSGGTTKWVDVRPGFTMGDKQEVFGELTPGDTIVLKGNEELKAGKHVIPKISK